LPGSYRAKSLENAKKWLFLAILAKNRLFGGIYPKKAFLGLFGPLRARVLHQPLARGPGAAQGPGRALPGSREPRGPGTGSRRPLRTGSGGPPPGGRGTPARTRSRSPGTAGARGFYINPSRRPPAVPGRGPGVPGSRGGPGEPPGPPGEPGGPSPAGEAWKTPLFQTPGPRGTRAGVPGSPRVGEAPIGARGESPSFREGPSPEALAEARTRSVKVVLGHVSAITIKINT